MHSTLMNFPARSLRWLGRQGIRAIALAVFVPIFFPPLSTLLKPYVAESVFCLLVIAFLRLETEKLKGYARNPAPVIAGALWNAAAIPALFAIACLLTGAENLAPELYLALMLQAIAPPIMSSPAFASLMRLDATLVLTTLVATAALSPLTAMAVTALMGLDVSLSPLVFGMKLFLIVAGSALLAAIIRMFAGYDRIRERSEELDGVNIILMFVFVASIMENVGSTMLSSPLLMLGLTLLGFAIFLVLFAVTAAALAWTGRMAALSFALMSAMRNMGLMLAATGGAVPELAWFYIAVAQFPIFLAPYMLERPVKHLLRDTGD